MDDKKLNIELTIGETIVFFLFIAWFNQNAVSSVFKDCSEHRVLWNIESILEKELSESFRKDYDVIVRKAGVK